MSEVNLSAIDLNLLHVVATVLEERSATRAASKLHVTQSAVSNSLRRAREIFGDALVVREAHGLRPTARAAALLPRLRAWLQEARRLVADAPAFDRKRSTRTFTIACSDAVSIALLKPLLRVLGKTAPNTALHLQTLDRLISRDGLARGEVDLQIGIPPVLPAGQDAELVYRDPLVCIVRAGHPRVRGRLSLEAYAALPHVELSLFGVIDDTVDRALAAHGRSRMVKVALPHFSAIPLAVLESDCVALLSRRLARSFAERMPLQIVSAPLKFAPIEVRQVWHRRSADDEGTRFLRAAVRQAARTNA
jgi:DNA-binding transcriptional LysR family regulator